jgi:hypothetical protein
VQAAGPSVRRCVRACRRRRARCPARGCRRRCQAQTRTRARMYSPTQGCDARAGRPRGYIRRRRVHGRGAARAQRAGRTNLCGRGSSGGCGHIPGLRTTDVSTCSSLSELSSPKRETPRHSDQDSDQRRLFLETKGAVVENGRRKQRGHGTHVDGARVTAGCLAVSESEYPERLVDSACGARFALGR